MFLELTVRQLKSYTETVKMCLLRLLLKFKNLNERPKFSIEDYVRKQYICSTFTLKSKFDN